MCTAKDIILTEIPYLHIFGNATKVFDKARSKSVFQNGVIIICHVSWLRHTRGTTVFVFLASHLNLLLLNFALKFYSVDVLWIWQTLALSVARATDALKK